VAAILLALVPWIRTKMATAELHAAAPSVH
jgi:hypothetical protein